MSQPFAYLCSSTGLPSRVDRELADGMRRHFAGDYPAIRWWIEPACIDCGDAISDRPSCYEGPDLCPECARARSEHYDVPRPGGIERGPR